MSSHCLAIIGSRTPRRRILTERHGYRIAVIMNEFGDTAVSYAPVVLYLVHIDPIVGY